MELSPTVSAGEVWWAKPDPTVGREQSGRRPVLVVSGDEYNATVTTMAIVLPITTQDRGWDNHVELAGPHGLGRDSWAMTEQIRAVSRERLSSRTGLVTSDCLQECRTWVEDYLR